MRLLPSPTMVMGLIGRGRGLCVPTGRSLVTSRGTAPLTAVSVGRRGGGGGASYGVPSIPHGPACGLSHRRHRLSTVTYGAPGRNAEPSDGDAAFEASAVSRLVDEIKAVVAEYEQDGTLDGGPPDLKGAKMVSELAGHSSSRVWV